MHCEILTETPTNQRMIYVAYAVQWQNISRKTKKKFIQKKIWTACVGHNLTIHDKYPLKLISECVNKRWQIRLDFNAIARKCKALSVAGNFKVSNSSWSKNSSPHPVWPTFKYQLSYNACFAIRNVSEKPRHNRSISMFQWALFWDYRAIIF